MMDTGTYRSILPEPPCVTGIGDITRARDWAKKLSRQNPDLVFTVVARMYPGDYAVFEEQNKLRLQRGRSDVFTTLATYFNNKCTYTNALMKAQIQGKATVIKW